MITCLLGKVVCAPGVFSDQAHRSGAGNGTRLSSGDLHCYSAKTISARLQGVSSGSTFMFRSLGYTFAQFAASALKSKPGARQMVAFAGKLALAPMVRSGELPTRLMALEHGADLVWGPEVVDKKIIKCLRSQNDKLGTVDFLEPNGKVAFRTLPSKEKGRLIFQLGSADPDLAAQAAAVVAGDVDGIDLNCGCPKPFSTHAGMGAALLSDPERLTLILSRLVKDVGKKFNIPISAKIRLLDEHDPQPSLDLIRKICDTGISNLTLHCRTRSMRNRESPIRQFLPEIIETVQSRNVSFMINGAIRNRSEFEALRQEFGSSVGGMIAESAEANPSVFSEKPLAWNQVVPKFIDIAESLDNHISNTKYVVTNQIPGKSPLYQMVCQAKTYKDLNESLKSIDQFAEGDKIIIRYLQKHILLDPEAFDQYEYSTTTKKRRSLQSDSARDLSNEDKSKLLKTA